MGVRLKFYFKFQKFNWNLFQILKWIILNSEAVLMTTNSMENVMICKGVPRGLHSNNNRGGIELQPMKVSWRWLYQASIMLLWGWHHKFHQLISEVSSIWVRKRNKQLDFCRVIQCIKKNSCNQIWWMKILTKCLIQMIDSQVLLTL